MHSGLLLIAATCLAGCPGPQDPTNPDSNLLDGSPEDDGNSSDSKLRIAWATTPVVPGTTSLGHQLNEVRFRMENLKATVDVDPNDPNTTRAEVKLRWDDEKQPETVTFSDAPAGRYTQIVLKLDEGDNEDAYEFRGLSNQGDSFRLEDDATISISMACNFMLLPGEDKTVTVNIDLQTAVDAVDIEALAEGEGVAHYLNADEDLVVAEQLRNGLRAAFSVQTQ